MNLYCRLCQQTKGFKRTSESEVLQGVFFVVYVCPKCSYRLHVKEERDGKERTTSARPPAGSGVL